MTIEEIRSNYLRFFEGKGHAVISPAPLVLENDPTTLFTSSGMQPLVPYLLGETHPSGRRLVDSQPSIRVQDIEEVGDNRHTTFFEMLGNWSLGDYFKKEQLPWIYEFLTKDLGLPKEKLYVSVFEGNNLVPKDTESIEIWKSLGIPTAHIYEYGVKKNWWSRSGTPDEMPVGEPGGPTSEIFFEFSEIPHDKTYGEECHPNCDCGRFIEVGNSVFMVYKKTANGLEELENKNVDFGGGLERIAAAQNGKPDVFEIDILQKLIQEVEVQVQKKYKDDKQSFRVIVDHIRAATFLAKSGVIPANKLQGYIMRRFIRRAILKARKLKEKMVEPTIFSSLVSEIITAYDGVYFDKKDTQKIQEIISEEVYKFSKTLDTGLREVQKISEIDGKVAFDLYQTYGFPLELSMEIFQEKGQKIDTEQFRKAFEEHQNKSRTASAGVFKGGLADHSVEVTRLHTATHLLHAALRKVLGTHVQQKGSNITSERLRFDFVHDQKVTPEQITEIENLINTEVDKNLPVNFEMMSIEEADKKGALHFFDKKYDEKVKVYTIGNSDTDFFSKEVCGGPHVSHLSELLGHVRITKEEAVSAGVRRIYATIQ